MRYISVKEMQKRIDNYFKACEGKEMTKEGEPVYDKQGLPIIKGNKPPTVTGLALAIGLKSRQELFEYRAMPRYQDQLLRAISRCEEYAETKLYDSASGIKYQLSHNFSGWSDEKDQKSPKTINVTIK